MNEICAPPSSKVYWEWPVFLHSRHPSAAHQPQVLQPKPIGFWNCSKSLRKWKKIKKRTQSSLAGKEKLPREKLLFPEAMVEMGVCLSCFSKSHSVWWIMWSTVDWGALAFGYYWVPKSFYYSKLWNFV